MNSSLLIHAQARSYNSFYFLLGPPQSHPSPNESCAWVGTQDTLALCSTTSYALIHHLVSHVRSRSLVQRFSNVSLFQLSVSAMPFNTDMCERIFFLPGRKMKLFADGNTVLWVACNKQWVGWEYGPEIKCIIGFVYMKPNTKPKTKAHQATSSYRVPDTLLRSRL